MKYRELLKLYKDGKLPQEEEEKIRDEIEKHEAISDFLFDEDMPELEGLSSRDCREDEKSDEFLHLVKRSIRHAFIKTGIISGTVVLCLVLFVIFLLPKTVDKFYYDPNEIAGKGENHALDTNRMSLDMSVYSELFLPQAFRNEVRAESEGYGEYFISIPQVVYSPDGGLKTVNGKLERNSLHLYDTDTFEEPVGNAFLMPEGIYSNHHFTDADGEPVGPQGRREDAIKNLKEKEERYYGAFISLKEITDYEEAIKWADESLSGSELWCAVAILDEYDHTMETNIGFRPRGAGLCINYDRENYPSLSLLDEENNNFESYKDEDKMKEHFISLLKYERDYPEFLNMTGHSTYSDSFFDDCISIVEKNGLKLHGFYIEAKRDDILELWENEKVSYIYTTNLK